ncbi:MAG: MFS transporter [Trueperaceae bacterium]|nr:MFS transporter [Trueperaceae bacterium]
MTRLVARRTALGAAGLTVLLTTAHAVNDAFANILPVFLPTLQIRFGLGEAALAGFVALISFSSNVLQAFAGALADRWGRRRAAAAGLIVGSSLMSLLVVVPTVWALFLVLAIGGLGSALFHPAAASMARQAGKRKGLAIGVFGSGGPLGSAVMPVVALWLLRSYGPWAIPWLAPIGVVLGVALLTLAPEQTRPERHARPKLFDRELFAGPVGLLAGVGILRAVAYISFLNAMPLYLVNVRGFAADAGILGFTLATYQIAASAGLVIAGSLEPYVGRGRLIVGAMTLALPLMLLTLVLTPGTVAFYLVVAAAGGFTNAPIPLLVLSAQDLAPNAVATASGMLMGFTWGVAGVAYVAFGALQQAVGIVPALATSYAFLVPAALLAVHVFRRHRDVLG